jgi:hypothetical protein
MCILQIINHALLVSLIFPDRILKRAALIYVFYVLNISAKNVNSRTAREEGARDTPFGRSDHKHIQSVRPINGKRDEAYA